MSHEVESVMYVGQTPWYGFGTYVGDNPITSKEAIVAAGLDWDVKLQDIFTGTMLPTPILNDVDTHKAVVRQSDNQVLGVVGNRYQPIQNVEAFQFMDGLVDDGSMRYHTAGSLRDGKRVWLLGKVGSYDVVDGDQVDEYLFLWNSHDGSTALRCLPTTVRVVCANTARVALAKGVKDGIRLHHTSNIKCNMLQAQEVLKLSQSSLSSFRSNAVHLAGKQINTKTLDTFVTNLFPDPPKDVRKTRVEKAREDVTRLFEDGTGNALPGVKGTAWAAFNAVTEYSNYYRAARGQNKQERRLEQTLFGTGANLIDKAQSLLLAA